MVCCTYMHNAFINKDKGINTCSDKFLYLMMDGYFHETGIYRNYEFKIDFFYFMFLEIFIFTYNYISNFSIHFQ